jgi:hypothetical protein
MTQARVILALIVAIALSVGITLFGADYHRLRNAAAQNEQRGGVITATDAGIKQGESIDAAQDIYQRGLADARAGFQQTKSEAQRNEPETAARAVRPVPDSVRNAYRERRRARERLGCTARECREDD